MGAGTGARRTEVLSGGQGAAQTALLLCRLDEIADGGARGIAVPGLERKVVVVRKGDRVHGYLDSCPHYEGSTPMAWKSDAYLNGERTHIACHSHGALFDIETGECVLGPCLGKALTPVRLRVGEQGGVEMLAERVREEVE